MFWKTKCKGCEERDKFLAAFMEMRGPLTAVKTIQMEGTGAVVFDDGSKINFCTGDSIQMTFTWTGVEK